MAVSYTHLDVYKRQVIASPTANTIRAISQSTVNGMGIIAHSFLFPSRGAGKKTSFLG